MYLVLKQLHEPINHSDNDLNVMVLTYCWRQLPQVSKVLLQQNKKCCVATKKYLS